VWNVIHIRAEFGQFGAGVLPRLLSTPTCQNHTTIFGAVILTSRRVRESEIPKVPAARRGPPRTP
jgi:hypothetical protein